jgi:hypothetical protein
MGHKNKLRVEEESTVPLRHKMGIQTHVIPTKLMSSKIKKPDSLTVLTNITSITLTAKRTTTNYRNAGTLSQETGLQNQNIKKNK